MGVSREMARQGRDSLLNDVQHLCVQRSVFMFRQFLELRVKVVGKPQRDLFHASTIPPYAIYLMVK
jgi:hypothetical protein